MSPTRRDFLKTSGGVLICACAGGSVSGCAYFGTSNMPTVPANAFRASGNRLVINVAQVPSLAVVGGSAKWVSTSGEERKICIVRSGENEFEAYINHCTHGGWELEYKHEEKRLRCVSFGHSEFDLEGHKLGGPAKGNLTKLAVTRIGDSLEIAI